MPKVRPFEGCDARIELPGAVMLPASKAAACRALEIDEDTLEKVIDGALALVPGVGALDESAALDRDLEFGDFTSVDGIASRVPDLVMKHVPIEEERLRRLGDVRIDTIDDLYTPYLGIMALADQLRRLLELRAPEIIVRDQRVRMQRRFEALVAARSGRARALEWQTYDQLMTGAPASPLCEAPLALFASEADDPTEPCDCFVTPSGFVVLHPYASAVIGTDGKVRDVFPTCGLRPVGATDAMILFVCGGGPASSSGYFTPTPIVRDIAKRRWVIGALPKGLPRYVAGTIGDVKWSIVADLRDARGYRMSPDWVGDQCGFTTTSLDGAYAYDGTTFMLEAATGKPILDMRRLAHDVISFTRRADGVWRFVGVPGRIVDETGAVIATPAHAVCALDAAGERVLSVSKKALVYAELSGKTLARFDLAPLAKELALPADTPLWRSLLGTFGVAQHVPSTLNEIRAAFVAGGVMDEDFADDEIERAISVARKRPAVPSTVRARGARGSIRNAR